MPTWPASLPQYPLRNSYGEELPSPVISAKPDTGPPLSRLRFTAAPTDLTVEFNFSETQLATFEDFYNDDIAMGALPFVAPLRDSTSETATYQIVGRPKIVRVGATSWRASMAWMRLP